jgi:hypothetical protein
MSVFVQNLLCSINSIAFHMQPELVYFVKDLCIQFKIYKMYYQHTRYWMTSAGLHFSLRHSLGVVMFQHFSQPKNTRRSASPYKGTLALYGYGSAPNWCHMIRPRHQVAYQKMKNPNKVPQLIIIWWFHIRTGRQSDVTFLYHTQYCMTLDK